MGGVRNGINLDPVFYLMAALQDRFAALDEETRLASMTEMLAFARKPGESINAVLSRYEIVRMRAATEGQFVISVEGCALQLLRACNVHPQQLMFILQPSGGFHRSTLGVPRGGIVGRPEKPGKTIKKPRKTRKNPDVCSRWQRAENLECQERGASHACAGTLMHTRGLQSCV